MTVMPIVQGIIVSICFLEVCISVTVHNRIEVCGSLSHLPHSERREVLPQCDVINAECLLEIGIFFSIEIGVKNRSEIFAHINERLGSIARIIFTAYIDVYAPIYARNASV